MGMYTNLGLVKHAEMALSLKTKYMWGGLLRPITDKYIATLKSIYGTNANTGYSAMRYNELANFANKGYYGVDCVGMIKSYYWSGKPDGGTGSPNYGATGYPDVNATYMYQQAKVKGDIKTMPETPGLIVYSKSHPHVGIYIGNGYAIESTLGSRGDGVVKRKLDNFWEYWFECPYIEYVKSKPTPELVAVGESVKFIYQAISNAAIRAGTSKSTKIYGRVTKYDFYPADQKFSTGWFKHADKQAYSKLEDGGSLFSMVGQYTIKYVKVNQLNIRSEPTIKSGKLATLKFSTKVYVWNEAPKKADGYLWYKCIINNKVGYVAGEYLR